MKNLLALAFASLLAGCGSSLGTPETDAPVTPLEGPGARLDSVSPAFASPAMVVTVKGAGFIPGDTQVFFGDLAGEVVSSTWNTITVHPAAPSAESRGAVALTVRTGETVLGPISFELGARGDTRSIDTSPALSAGDVAVLADGTTLMSDPDDNRLYRIGTDGWVSVAGEFPGLSPRRLSSIGDGSPLVATSEGIAGFDGSLLVTVMPNGASPLVSGVRAAGTIFALSADGWIERLGPEGGEIVAVPGGACEYPADITAANGALWIVTYTGAVCAVDPVSFDVTPLSLTGEQPMELWSVDGASGALVVAGVFPGWVDAVATISLEGAVTVNATLPMGGYGAAALSAATTRVALSNADVVDVGSSLSLVMAPVYGIADFAEVDGHRFVTAGDGFLQFAFIAEIDGEGNTRIVANSNHADSWVGLISEGNGSFVVASRNDSTILRVGGAGVTVLATTEGPIAGIASHPEGGILVSSYGSDIARYAADGTLLDAQFVNGAGAAAGVSFAADGTIYVASGEQIYSAGAAGGAAQLLVDRGHADGFNDVLRTADGRIFAADGDDTGTIYERTALGTLEPLASGTSVASVSMSADGSMLVADRADLPFIVLP